MYPRDASQLPAPKYPFSPKNVPDVAFTAELDGQNTMSINEDLPGNIPSRPAVDQKKKGKKENQTKPKEQIIT